VNLAWKLAWVEDHGLGATEAFALLDTYETERRPHVRAITEAVIAFGDVICSRDAEYAAARDVRLVADPRPPERRIPFSLPRMEPGPLVLEGGGRLFGQPEVKHGDVPLDDLLGPRFAVIARDPTAVGDPTWWREELDATILVPDGDGPLDAFLYAALDRAKASLVVIRPDRYILYAGDDPRVPRRAVSTLLDLNDGVRVA
jgi:3-(3-hydroxy-phenyl)propionate hydroxylase